MMAALPLVLIVNARKSTSVSSVVVVSLLLLQSLCFCYSYSVAVTITLLLLACCSMCMGGSWGRSLPEVHRIVAMLRSPSPILCICSAFALLQFTMPGGRNSHHHCSLLSDLGGLRAVRGAAASMQRRFYVKLLARMVLQNVHSVCG